MSTKGGQFLHLACQGGGRFAPLPLPSVTPLVIGLCLVLVVIEAFSLYETVA